jgi:hypothetical protein
MEKCMKANWIAVAVAAGVTLGTAFAADKKAGKSDAAHVQSAAADHRAMADAHLNAAKCLESGSPEKACHEQLGKDCKGLGIGKYCGMKHRH